MPRFARNFADAVRSPMHDDRAFRILAAAMFGPKPERVYFTNSKGQKVRQFSKECPCGKADVYELLAGNRMVEEDEALEIIGENALRHLVSAGYLVRGTTYKWQLFITEKGAQNYGLPHYKGKRTFFPAPKTSKH